MLRISRLCSPFSIRAGVLLLATLLLIGCTSAGVHPPEANPIEQRGELGVAYMPYGESLLSPDRLDEAERPEQSAYGCYLAEREMKPDAEWDVSNIYLHFPQEMMDAAGSERMNVVYEAKNEEVGFTYKVANCQIPDAEGARSLLAKLLNLPDESPAEE